MTSNVHDLRPDESATRLDQDLPRAGTALAVRKPTMTEKVHWSEQLSRSSLLPRDYQGNPANLLFAVEYAETLGLSTMAAVQGIHVIKGKPSASAALMTALVRKAGHRVRSGYTAAEDGGWGTGWCEIVRADDPTYTFRTAWSLDDAVRAELCTLTKDGNPYSRSSKGEKQSWEKYPKAMLTWRAVTECVRQACEEVLYGAHYTADEMGMEMTADGEAIIVEGEVVGTEYHRDDIAHKLVGDPDPVQAPDWAAELVKAGTDPSALGKLLKWAHDAAPEDTDLHERISSTVPWQQLIGDLAAVADADGLLSLYRRAVGMRPQDAGLHEQIKAAGVKARAGERVTVQDTAGADDVIDAEVVSETPAGQTKTQQRQLSVEILKAAASGFDDLIAATTARAARDAVDAALASPASEHDISGFFGHAPDSAMLAQLEQTQENLGIREGESVSLAGLAALVADYWERHRRPVTSLPDAPPVAEDAAA